MCSRAQMSWRHDVIAETWQAICRDAILSAHFNKKLQSSRLVSFDGPRCLFSGEWQIAGKGVAVAREERRNLPRLGSRRNIGMYGEISPIGLREPRPVEAKRCRRAGATGSIEGRHDGRVTGRWLSVLLQRGNAAMVLAALWQPQPARTCSKVRAMFTWKQVPADRCPRA